MNSTTVHIAESSRKIHAILAGQAGAVQGAILADCLAMWLAGHHVAGDTTATRAMRAELLAAHLLSVEELVLVNARLMGTTP